MAGRTKAETEQHPRGCGKKGKPVFGFPPLTATPRRRLPLRVRFGWRANKERCRCSEREANGRCRRLRILARVAMRLPPWSQGSSTCELTKHSMSSLRADLGAGTISTNIASHLDFASSGRRPRPTPLPCSVGLAPATYAANAPAPETQTYSSTGILELCVGSAGQQFSNHRAEFHKVGINGRLAKISVEAQSHCRLPIAQ